MRILITFFANSSLFIALMALSFYYFYAEVLTHQFNINQAIIIFCATLFSYIGVQLYPSFNSLKATETKRSLWIKEHKKLLTAFAIISFLFLFYFAFKIKIELLFIYFHLFILTLFYENILTVRFSIRRIPYIKPFVIAYIWSWTCIPYTSLYQSLLPHLEAFTFILALSIPFDIRDMENDIKDGILTIPIKLGLKWTKILCLLIFFVFLTLQAYLIPTSIAFFVLSGLFFLVYSFMLYKTYPYQNDALFLYGFDGLICIKLLFLLVI